MLYLEELALPESILTVPEATLLAFADHGHPTAPAPARGELGALETDIDLAAITTELEHEGIDAFLADYRRLLACVRARTAEPEHEPALWQ